MKAYRNWQPNQRASVLSRVAVLFPFVRISLFILSPFFFFVLRVSFVIRYITRCLRKGQFFPWDAVLAVNDSGFILCHSCFFYARERHKKILQFVTLLLCSLITFLYLPTPKDFKRHAAPDDALGESPSLHFVVFVSKSSIFCYQGWLSWFNKAKPVYVEFCTTPSSSDDELLVVSSERTQ